MTDVFNRPPRRVLPLSKGGDLVVDFLQSIGGVYVNYDIGVNVNLVIESTPHSAGVIAPAVTVDYHAVCKVESGIVDDIPAGTIWRCVVSYPTIPTTEIVAMNGITDRADS